MKLQDEILKTIEISIQKYKNTCIQSRDVSSIVTNINNDKFEVDIDGVKYWIKNGVDISLSTGDHVWVHVPNGNMNEMFIMARK